jgi:hypothetical protein
MSITIVRGYNVQVGYKEETTEGTIPDGASGNPITYDYLGHITGLTPTINPNPIEIRPLGIRYPLTHVKGTREIALSVEYHPISKTPLQYAISNITKTITVWEKIIDLNASLLYTGLRCNRLRIRGEVGRPLTVTQEFIGKDVSTTPPSYANLPSVSTSLPFHFPDQNVTLGGSALSGKVSGFEADIVNNVEAIYQVGDVVSATKVERLIEVTGNVTMTFSSLSDLQDVLALTEKTNLAMILGREGASSVTLTIPKMVWTSYPKPIRVGEVIRITLPFRSQGAMPTIA